LIIHAGDVGGPGILEALGRVAPVRAVRGNTDRGDFGRSLPLTEVVEVGGMQLYVLHELYTLDLDPRAAGFAAVIFGHSHRPHLERQHGVLFLNPGSAGPRHFNLPVTLARLKIREDGLHPEFVELLK
jgi:putative phosphoesterase